MAFDSTLDQALAALVAAGEGCSLLFHVKTTSKIEIIGAADIGHGRVRLLCPIGAELIEFDGVVRIGTVIVLDRQTYPAPGNLCGYWEALVIHTVFERDLGDLLKSIFLARIRHLDDDFFCAAPGELGVSVLVVKFDGPQQGFLWKGNDDRLRARHPTSRCPLTPRIFVQQQTPIELRCIATRIMPRASRPKPIISTQLADPP